MSKTSPDLVFVAAIAGAHGVRGECKVKSFTGEPEAAFAYGPFLDAKGKTVFTPARYRRAKEGFVVAFKENLTREQAQAARGTQLFIPRSALPELEEDEFYHSDLLGLKVQALDGTPMGRIRAVHDFGGGDLLEIVDTPDRKGAWMIPFTREQVPHISIIDKLVTIDPLEEIEGDAPASDE
ncbi:ribosome maturation factor RimM [Maricaulis sp.]|uniref:ribosome maturation factor RimM n=1 Tax=Maricaulis sp. TaxID=1486257 RepID=UPI00260F419F|nr:ribosome maturation factor RimM [Maricaulis sp.]